VPPRSHGCFALLLQRLDGATRSAENKLRVVAVRIDSVIEQRSRVVAEATERKQSSFLQRMTTFCSASARCASNLSFYDSLALIDSWPFRGAPA
jgi:hypothetical protein